MADAMKGRLLRKGNKSRSRTDGDGAGPLPFWADFENLCLLFTAMSRILLLKLEMYDQDHVESQEISCSERCALAGGLNCTRLPRAIARAPSA